MACSSSQKETSKEESPEMSDTRFSVFAWEGFINGKIPVFLQYQLDSTLLMGEITYLNTKNKTPIKILGGLDGEYLRLIEFCSDGNITGIMIAKSEQEKLEGTWISPSSGTDYDLRLSLKDTLIESTEMTYENDIPGTYYFQFGKNGRSGELEIERIDDKRVAFFILGMTDQNQGPNLAEVDKDTVELVGNSFVYKLPYSDSCSFKVEFFRNFAVINYLGDQCHNQFGHNATIEGLYLKVDDENE